MIELFWKVSDLKLYKILCLLPFEGDALVFLRPISNYVCKVEEKYSRCICILTQIVVESGSH
jgi:hypothetical protein